MTAERWRTLSDWHNAWLTADPGERDRLRQQLAEDDPELVVVAERLIAGSGSLQGFLETPAFVLAATELAARESRLGSVTPAGGLASGRTLWIAGTGLLALSMAVVAGFWRLSSRPRLPVETPLVRFTVPMPPGLGLLSAPAVSPDGERIAFVAGDRSGSRLMVRPLGSDSSAVVEGTEGATSPFWSPDGEWIGYSGGGHLMKVARAGGAPVVIDGAVGNWGGAWGPSGVVVFQPAVRNAGLVRIPASGGRSESASILADAAGDISHRFPVMLPDGLSFLYYVISTDIARQGMYVGRLDTAASPPSRRVGTGDAHATFVALPGGTGLLLWAVGNRLETQSFDLARMHVGDSQAIDIAAAPATQSSPAMLGATADVLAYATVAPGPSPAHEMRVVIGWRRLVHRK